MGYVKRKCSNAEKVTASHFEEVKEVFLADITVGAVMNDIPSELIFNYVGPNTSPLCTHQRMDSALCWRDDHSN